MNNATRWGVWLAMAGFMACTGPVGPTTMAEAPLGNPELVQDHERWTLTADLTESSSASVTIKSPEPSGEHFWKISLRPDDGSPYRRGRIGYVPPTGELVQTKVMEIATGATYTLWIRAYERKGSPINDAFVNTGEVIETETSGDRISETEMKAHLTCAEPCKGATDVVHAKSRRFGTLWYSEIVIFHAADDTNKSTCPDKYGFRTNRYSKIGPEEYRDGCAYGVKPALDPTDS